MGRTGPKLPSFCLNRIRPLVRVRSPQIQSKFDPNPPKNDIKTGCTGGADQQKPGDHHDNNIGAKTGSAIGRKIMIVVDSSFEAKGALQWALSHTVQSQDKLVLLHVTKSSKQGIKFFFLFFYSFRQSLWRREVFSRCVDGIGKPNVSC